MIGLDTNVLVRYLVTDDLVQAKKATRLIEGAVSKGDKFFINTIVLCELAWVLSAAYDYPKAIIIETLEKILMTQQFEIEDKATVRQALDQFKTSSADFSDCLLSSRNLALGCTVTASFDKRFTSLSQMVL